MSALCCHQATRLYEMKLQSHHFIQMHSYHIEYAHSSSLQWYLAQLFTADDLHNKTVRFTRSLVSIALFPSYL